ncbi:MAG: Ig-like domain-containing protein, partial [Gemmatimonadota bacterium]
MSDRRPLCRASRAFHLLCGAVLLYPLFSCARMEAPSGGPEDTRPPVVVSTEPDTFAVVEDFGGPVVIRFSERISEQPQGGTV